MKTPEEVAQMLYPLDDLDPPDEAMREAHEIALIAIQTDRAQIRGALFAELEALMSRNFPEKC